MARDENKRIKMSLYKKICIHGFQIVYDCENGTRLQCLLLLSWKSKYVYNISI